MPSSVEWLLVCYSSRGALRGVSTLVFIRPRTARRGSANRPKPSALHKQGALARLRLLNSGWRETLSDDPARDLAMQLLDTHSLRRPIARSLPRP